MGSSIPEVFESNKTTTIEFQLDEFEGPLDLLLFLIQKAEVNIYDITNGITKRLLEKYKPTYNGL